MYFLDVLSKLVSKRVERVDVLRENRCFFRGKNDGNGYFIANFTFIVI